MKQIKYHGVVTVTVYIAVAVNSLFLSLNGLFMLIDPKTWYDLVPGVTDTGFFNQHFIRDIGIVQLFLGMTFGIGMFRHGRRVALWAGATLWLIAHALFHFWEVSVGICAASALVRDFPAVTLPALIGMTAVVWAWRQQPSQPHPG